MSAEYFIIIYKIKLLKQTNFCFSFWFPAFVLVICFLCKYKCVDTKIGNTTSKQENRSLIKKMKTNIINMIKMTMLFFNVSKQI